MTLTDWQALSESERRTIASTWSPDDTSGVDPLLEELVVAFRESYPQLDIRGLGNVHGSLKLVVMRPFIFYRRQAPEFFLGLGVRYTLSEPVPVGFQVHDGYIWAPENYLSFVDSNIAEIRERLGEPSMSREEILAALVGMPFDDWIERCRQFGLRHTGMVPGQRNLDRTQGGGYGDA